MNAICSTSQLTEIGFLLETDTPKTFGGRGMVTGRIWTVRDGQLIATVGQEGIVKPEPKLFKM